MSPLAVIRSLTSAVAVGAVISSLYFVYRILKRVYRTHTSPLRSVPGPPTVSYLFGSFDLISESNAFRLFQRWSRQYGDTYKFTSILQANKLWTADLRALTHVLASDAYQKTDILVRFSPQYSQSLSQGLLFVGGIRHAQLRKIMNFAFCYAQVREYTGAFLDKAAEMRDLWIAEATQSGRKDGAIRVDVLNWVSRMTLDGIGLAGFDYIFDSLRDDDSNANELLATVRELFTFNFLKLSFLIQLFFPLTRIIRTQHMRDSAKRIEVISRVGSRLIAEKKAVIAAGADGPIHGEAKRNPRSRDLLSLLIQTSLTTDTGDSTRMTEEELIAQIPSILVAGHETTAVTAAWTLFSLAINPSVQAKLRAEALAVPTDSPSMDVLNTLPYLDAVVRESLRVHSPVSFTERTVLRTDEIPLDSSFVDVNGVERNTVRVAKGDKISLPLQTINVSKKLWGDDAEEFRPERWLDNSIPTAVRAIPSIYSNTMSFLSGSHSCIGYRIALIQIKAMLFTLSRAFEVDLAVSPEDIGRNNNIVGRPYLASDPGAGPQLPMVIRPVYSD
ncbi:cytochrome P450 [Auriscalpium vulgare]|uniref:Cytochrome P450 n=1 Tax=Auriscalpium vulgare TaxID=40419 RepID=A0ACB8S752_9AGAM|nr:cytochrome P450 [Auriscalpium vulgare]